jgi:hypothetical protein
MNENKVGYIYILTNKSFPDLVKIGYADDIDKRLETLNSNSGLPYSFKKYATYRVEERLEDIKLHTIIDKLNPSLRTVEENDGKKRIREFFKITKEDAYLLFEAIAEISGTADRLVCYATKKEQEAIKERELQINRHHFKEIEFHSSLTNKSYYTKTNEKGTLSVYEKETNIEVPNNSKPSKKQIILQALKDLNVDASNKETLYQLMRKLQKNV